jgi:hypothetical protein
MAPIWKLLVAALASGALAWLSVEIAVAQQQPAPPAAAAPAEAEESPLLREPTTPPERFRAVLLMLRLGRPKLARMYLQQLMDSQPDDATLLALRDEHGPAVFLRLATEPDLQPLATDLLNGVNRAFRAQASDPNRIDALVAGLARGPSEAAQALIALQNAGQAPVPRLVMHLGDPQRWQQRDKIVLALVRIGRPAVAPLLGAIDAPDESIKTGAMQALGIIGDRAAIPYLWHPAFAKGGALGVQAAARTALAQILYGPNATIGQVSPYGAADELKRIAIEHFSGQYPWEPDEQGLVTIWNWSPEAQTVVPSVVAPEAASAYLAEKFARQARELAPDRAEMQALALAAFLGFSVRTHGLDGPAQAGAAVPDSAVAAGAELAAQALSLALDNGNAAAALGAIRILTQSAGRQQVRDPMAPLLAALNYPDERVQFEAACAILEIDPPKQFPGSERVVAVLTRALTDTGAPRSVVIDANLQRANNVAGFLRNMGYDSRIARTGRDGFALATDLAGVELIAVNANVIRWELSQTIANLRADSRTSAVPIVIFGPEENERRIAPLLTRTKRAAFIEEAVTSEFFTAQLRPFLAQVRTPAPTDAQRQRMKEQAAYWMAHIASAQRNEIFNILPAEPVLVDVAQDPSLSDNALLALTAIPTASAQRTMMEMAVNEIGDAVLRRSAALQLAFHIQRHGVLLTSAEVGKLEASWKRAADPALATALASLMGTLRSFARPPESALPQLPVPALKSP